MITYQRDPIRVRRQELLHVAGWRGCQPVEDGHGHGIRERRRTLTQRSGRGRCRRRQGYGGIANPLQVLLAGQERCLKLSPKVNAPLPERLVLRPAAEAHAIEDSPHCLVLAGLARLIPGDIRDVRLDFRS